MKKNKEKNFNFIILVLLLILVFTVFAAIMGSFYFKPNFIKNFGPGEINLQSPEYSNTSFIIQDPKRVYISQDLKIDESINYLSEAVFGIFPKTKEGNYNITEELLAGVIISSDGWILFNSLGLDNVSKNILSNKDLHVVISKKNKKIYSIEEIYHFSDPGIVFVKIKDSNSFSVRNFVNPNDLREGHSLIAYNFSGDLMINYLKRLNSGTIVKNFDGFKNSIDLNNQLSDSFKNNFLFNLNGDLLALVDSSSVIRPIHDFRPYVYGFLKNKEFKIFKLGLYYSNLKDWAGEKLPLMGSWVYNNGASAVIKGGLADKSGILTGDVIIRVNNYEINNYSNLNDVLNNFLIGDKVTFFILRDGESIEIKVDLK